MACGSRSRRNILINHAKVKQFPTPFGRKLPFSIDLSQRRISGSWTASHFMQLFANWYKPTVFGKVSVIVTMLLLIAFCMSNYSRTIRRWYIIFYCVYVFLCPGPRHEPTNEINWTEFTTLVWANPHHDSRHCFAHGSQWGNFAPPQIPWRTPSQTLNPFSEVSSTQ